MAFRRRRQSCRGRPKRRAGGFRRYKAKVRRASIKRVVKQVIRRDVETKTAESGMATNQLYYPQNIAMFMSNNIIRLTPGTNLPILQGVGNSNRVGNRCCIRKLLFNLQIRPRAYDLDSNAVPRPQVGKIVLFYMRKTPTTVDATGNEPIVDFFQLNNTTDSIKGQMVDQLQQYNTDKYRVFATRTFKIGYSDYEGTGTVPTQQNYANNDFKYSYMLKWDITRYVPKLLRWNDNEATPMSRALYAMIYFAPSDGSTGPGNQIVLQSTYWLQCKYEDA